jgi:hypothetical protein
MPVGHPLGSVLQLSGAACRQPGAIPLRPAGRAVLWLQPARRETVAKNIGVRVIAHDRRGHGRSSQGGGGHDMAAGVHPAIWCSPADPTKRRSSAIGRLRVAKLGDLLFGITPSCATPWEGDYWFECRASVALTTAAMAHRRKSRFSGRRVAETPA